MQTVDDQNTLQVPKNALKWDIVFFFFFFSWEHFPFLNIRGKDLEEKTKNGNSPNAKDIGTMATETTKSGHGYSSDNQNT